MCAMVKNPTFNRNPYNGYINPYYWVDDHPLLYGNNGGLDPGTCEEKNPPTLSPVHQTAISIGKKQHMSQTCAQCFFVRKKNQ